MGTTYAAGLALARLADPSEHQGPSVGTQGVANCAISAMRVGSFTYKWYRNPERPMSQSERLPS
jgi:hypothetical protein